MRFSFFHFSPIAAIELKQQQQENDALSVQINFNELLWSGEWRTIAECSLKPCII
jgi:hypothetical protein